MLIVLAIDSTAENNKALVTHLHSVFTELSADKSLHDKYQFVWSDVQTVLQILFFCSCFIPFQLIRVLKQLLTF
eukprot:m.151352 g.151352  ORF g.151352 m.151352 type:complete len:74 (-) comp14248_c0_seq8:1194-1415(-)